MSRNKYCATSKISLNEALVWRFAIFAHSPAPSLHQLVDIASVQLTTPISVAFLLSELILLDNSRHRLISRAAQDSLRLQPLPQHTWYVGVGVHRNATFTAQRSRNWLPHAFGLRARLRAFSFGYRVLPIPNRKGQSPKSSKSAASGYRRRPTRGGSTVLKDTTSNYLAKRNTSLLGDDFLRTTSA
jgi:hypothetical protein